MLFEQWRTNCSCCPLLIVNNKNQNQNSFKISKSSQIITLSLTWSMIFLHLLCKLCPHFILTFWWQIRSRDIISASPRGKPLQNLRRPFFVASCQNSGGGVPNPHKTWSLFASSLKSGGRFSLPPHYDPDKISNLRLITFAKCSLVNAHLQ